jgi:hypothetical protein
MNFGEVVSAFRGHKRTPSHIAERFKKFYLGFNSNSIIWFSYKDDEPHFETTFNFDDIHKDDEDKIAFVEIIIPGLLPSRVFGKDQSATYEFYNPSVCARQLGFGQLPIGLYFSDLITREIIPSGTCGSGPDSATIDLDSWRFSSFSSPLFNVWWAEWCDHLFCVSARIYYEQLDPDYVVSADEVLFLSIHFTHCLTIPIFVISSFSFSA